MINWYKLYKLAVFSYGLPDLGKSDIEDFLIGFLGYQLQSINGTHHVFSRKGYPNFVVSYSDRGKVDLQNSGFRHALREIKFSVVDFNEYWKNRKELLRKAKENQIQTVFEFKKKNGMELFPFEQQMKQKESVMDYNMEKVKKILQKFPTLARRFEYAKQSMSDDEYHRFIYEQIMSGENVKQAYGTV